MIRIDQAPIGRTPRSNPATYTGLFTPIRDLYAMLPESRERGYKPGRFSFNVKGGRCEACQGDGLKRIEMNFLPDVYVTCDVCRGRRYNHETLQVKYKGYSIADLLDATVEEALPLMENLPQIRAKLQTLIDVGLGYVHLGQSSTTLSGGEAQRIKLAKELSKRQTGRTFYLLDEPTTGLHFDDVRKLLDVLQRLVDLGNTVVVIEHNLDVMKTADWIIDLGPDGGEYGGRVVACGTPEQVAASQEELHGRGAAQGAAHRDGGMSKYASQPHRFRRSEDGAACDERGGKVKVGGFRDAVSQGRRAWRGCWIRCRSILAGEMLSRRGGCDRASARASGRAIIWGLGGHVIKCGLAPVLLDLMRRGYATAFAHERRRRRSTISRSRWPATPAKMWKRCCRTAASDRRKKPGREMNRAIARATTEALGDRRGAGPARWTQIARTTLRAHSLLASAPIGTAVPVTVHVAIGTDTPHTHPAADAARDRRRVAPRFPAVLLAGRRS